MENVHKSKAKRLKGDPYIGLCQSGIGTVECHMNGLL